MPSRDRPELAEIESFALHLDAQRNAGDALRPTGATRVPDNLAATAGVVQAASGPRGLTRRFADRLEENLMDLAALDHHQPNVPARRPAETDRRPWSAGALPTPVVVSRRRGRFQYAALAVVIAVVLGQVGGLGQRLIDWRSQTSTPLPAAQASDDATPTPAPPSSGSDGHLRVDSARTGVSQGPGPSGTPRLLWRWDNPVGDYSIQALNDGQTLYHVPTGGADVAMVTSDGANSAGIDESYIQTFIVIEGILVAAVGPSEEGALVAYRIAEGATQQWRVETRASAGALASDGDHVYMVDVDGVLHAHALADGAETWSVALRPDALDVIFQPASHVITDVSPAVAAGLVVVSTQGGKVRAFSADDGAELWTFTADEGHLGAPTIAGDAVYVAGRAEGEPLQAAPPLEGHVYAVDAATGEERWRHESAAWSGGAATSPIGNAHTPLVLTVDDTRVYLTGDGAGGNLVTALSVDSGDSLWSTEFDVVSGSSPIAAGDALYLTRPDGGVYGLDGASGEIRWRLDTGTANLLSPIVIGDVLVVVTGDGDALGLGASGDDAVTDVASPVATGDDISGLPPCISPRLRPDPLPTGEPSTELDIPERTGDNGSSIIRADIPTEPVAEGETLLKLLSTLDAMLDCDRPGKERELDGFFSDDYYRRTAMRYPDGFNWRGAQVLSSFEQISLADLPEPVILDDGRVAILLWTDLYREGQLVVFVEQDGVYLIDEIVRVTEEPGQPRG